MYIYCLIARNQPINKNLIQVFLELGANYLNFLRIILTEFNKDSKLMREEKLNNYTILLSNKRLSDKKGVFAE